MGYRTVGSSNPDKLPVQYPKRPLTTPHRTGLGVAFPDYARVPGAKAGSTVDISGAPPSAGTISCPVAGPKAPEASSAIHVSLSAA